MQYGALQVSLDFSARLLLFTLYSDAVKLGQADACVSCRIYAKTPGFSTCSKLCGGLLSLQNRMGGRGRGQDQAPPAPLVPPAPTNPSPIKNANKDEKNRAGNDFAYPCGCIIRILKMGPWGLVPNTCPMCSPPITKEPGAQTDSIDEFKATGKLSHLVCYILSIRSVTMLPSFVCLIPVG